VSTDAEMTRPPTFRIIARVHGPNATSDVRSTCAVLMDLLPANDLTDRAGELRKDSFILKHASATARHLCQLALHSGFELRFDLPPDTDVPGSWPAVVREASALEQVMGPLVQHANNDLLYPLSIWGIITANESATHRAINAFQSLRMDEGLFEDVLANHGFRIAVFQSSLTISVSCSDLDRTIAWARRALQEPGPRVSWADDDHGSAS